MIFGSLGVFAGSEADPGSFGARYEATRTPTGWVTRAMSPPASAALNGEAATEISSGLTTTLWNLRPLSASVYGGEYYLREANGAFTPVGPQLPPAVRIGPPGESGTSAQFASVQGASANLEHILFTIKLEPEKNVLWPGDETVASQQESLYEYAGTGNNAPRLVGVEDSGRQISQCGTELGRKGETYNAISESGGVVFFTPLPGGCSGEDRAGQRVTGTGPSVAELYARVGGLQTVDISEPTPAQCATCATTTRLAAEFQGASANGEKAFFSTEQELLPGQSTTNLYEYDFGAPPGQMVTLVSRGSPKPEVQGVVRVSQDGSHVYFVARAALTGENAERRSPLAGDENLYDYEQGPAHPAGRLTFVATLLSPALAKPLEAQIAQARREFIAARRACKNFRTECATPQELEALEATEARFKQLNNELGNAREVWSASDARRQAQTTPNGSFLVFCSIADLTAGDTSVAPQVFEYDAEAETLKRISIGQAGYNNDGNTEGDEARIVAPNYVGGVTSTTTESTATVSEDGADVVFESADALTPGAQPAAKAGATSVYEYHSGEVTLISDGRATTEFGVTSEFAGSTLSPDFGSLGIDASGQNVFFASGDALAPQQTSTQWGIYDARVNGGFPTATQPGCDGEGCQGARQATPPLAPPASSTFTAGSNLPPPTTPRTAPSKPKRKAKRTSRASCHIAARRLKSAKRRRHALALCGARGRRHSSGQKKRRKKRKQGRHGAKRRGRQIVKRKGRTGR
ncbi:MAG: hypothetical protein ACYCYN_07000 [Solirubrobacteraceae bacterium]